MAMIPDDVRDYIGSIRNAKKRAYADSYARFQYRQDLKITSPDPGTLSYMAAQAVRMNIISMLRGRERVS